MTAPGVSREHDRPTRGGPTGPLDIRPLLGRWSNFDRATGTGIQRAEIEGEAGRLLVRLSEAVDGTLRDWDAQAVIPLAATVGSEQAIGFRAQLELRPELGSRQVYLCGYLNRGLLTIDVHAAVPADPVSNAMYRAHFHRSEGPTGA